MEVKVRTIKLGVEAGIKTWLDEFVEFLKNQDLSMITIRGYSYDLSNFNTWLERIYDKPIMLDEITSHDIASYRQYLVETKKLKATSINRKIQAIRRLFSWCTNEFKLKNDNSKRIKSLKSATRYCPGGLSPKEVHAFLSVSGTSSHGLSKRNYALVQTLIQTGLRVSELIGLKLSDLTVHARSGKIRICAGKGLKEREVPLNTAVRRALMAYLKTRTNYTPEDHVFLTMRNKPYSIRGLQRIIQSLARRANITRIPVSPHTLRHTFAINFLKANPNKLVELSNLMGHESLDTTAIYVKPTQEEMAENLERSSLNAY
jgi:integrase/recombinase XerC